MATYYIDPIGVNDAGRTGLVGQEWATLSYACSRVTTSGDIIYVNAGSYNESSQIVKAVGVSITGTGDTSHIISTYTNASSLQAAIQCASTAGTTIDDNSSISYIKLTGSNLTSTRAIFVGYRNNLHIHHCTIEDFLYMGVYFYVSASYPTVYATELKLYNCVINNCASYGGGYQGNVRLSGTDRTEIYDCSFDNTFRPTGYNAHIFSTYRNKRLKIHDNVLIKNNHETTAEGVDTWNFFLEEWNYKGDSEFYNNTLYGLAKFSLGGDENDIEDGCTFGYKVYNNQWLNDTNGNRLNNGDDSTAYCLTVEGNNHNEVYVYNNLIQRFAWGLEIATPTSSTGGTWSQNWSNQNIYFYYNIITDVGYLDHAYSYGILVINEPNEDGYTNTLSNVHIYNNVITALDGVTYDGYQGIRVISNGTLTGLNIHNNIIQDFSSYAIYLIENAPGLALTNADVTHNCMYSNGTNSVYVDGNIDLTNIDVATGNITTDPLFVSSTDFHLQASSPCINEGIDVGLTTDYDDVAILGLPDIGAYEYFVEGTNISISTPVVLKFGII